MERALELKRISLLNLLRNYSKDYYTRGKAVEVYQTLKLQFHTLYFEDETHLSELKQLMEKLLMCEELTALSDYAQSFSDTLIRIILLIRKSNMS